MGLPSDGSRDDFHGFPGDAEEVSAPLIPIVLPREVILGKAWRGKLWFSTAQKRDWGCPATSAFGGTNFCRSCVAEARVGMSQVRNQPPRVEKNPVVANHLRYVLQPHSWCNAQTLCPTRSERKAWCLQRSTPSWKGQGRFDVGVSFA